MTMPTSETRPVEGRGARSARIEQCSHYHICEKVLHFLKRRRAQMQNRLFVLAILIVVSLLPEETRRFRRGAIRNRWTRFKVTSTTYLRAGRPLIG
jgi:hypothetical protein